LVWSICPDRLPDSCSRRGLRTANRREPSRTADRSRPGLTPSRSATGASRSGASCGQPSAPSSVNSPTLWNGRTDTAPQDAAGGRDGQVWHPSPTAGRDPSTDQPHVRGRRAPGDGCRSWVCLAFEWVFSARRGAAPSPPGGRSSRGCSGRGLPLGRIALGPELSCSRIRAVEALCGKVRGRLIGHSGSAERKGHAADRGAGSAGSFHPKTSVLGWLSENRPDAETSRSSHAGLPRIWRRGPNRCGAENDIEKTPATTSSAVRSNGCPPGTTWRSEPENRARGSPASPPGVAAVSGVRRRSSA
jgi:hypothetical protein